MALFQPVFSSPARSSWRDTVLFAEGSVPVYFERSADFRRNMIHRDDRFTAKDKGVLDGMLEFPDISRPAVAHERTQHLIGDAPDAFSRSFR